jgi:uncharacterized protein YcbK (DUF882 family)
MQSMTVTAAFAAALLCVSSTFVSASDGSASALEFMNSQQKNTTTSPAKAQPKSAATTRKITSRSRSARAPAGRAGVLAKQIPSVSTSCLKPSLVSIIRGASNHFGSQAVITSGYRPSRRSYHGKCMAADVQIAGVSPGALARYFRSQSAVGGVGTYGHTRSVHVDVAPRVYTWYHGRRRAG